jgi:hypothetical protein
MESTGFPNCIQISQVTADLLITAGKQAWMKPRSDMVNAKGKGLMQTYILEMNKYAANSNSGGSSNADSTVVKDIFVELTEVRDAKAVYSISSKNARLVEWITELLMAFIKEIAVRRSRTKSWKRSSIDEAILKTETGSSVLGEVKEIVTLPSLANRDGDNDAPNIDVEVDPVVGEQLRHYLSKISLMYLENPCKFTNNMYCLQEKILTKLTIG